MAIFPSQTTGVAHGALNWDTQVKNDFAALQALFEGTMVDRSPSNSPYTGDWNNLITSGTFQIAQGQPNTNGPFATGAIYAFGVLVVFAAGASAAIQQLYFANDGGIAFRSNYTGNGWTAWRKLASTLV